MIQTIEAIVSETGEVKLLTEIYSTESRRALVTILEQEPKASETALLSENALSQNWLYEDEEKARQHLQR